jgi:hypothetical protein
MLSSIDSGLVACIRLCITCEEIMIVFVRAGGHLRLVLANASFGRGCYRPGPWTFDGTRPVDSASTCGAVGSPQVLRGPDEPGLSSTIRVVERSA